MAPALPPSPRPAIDPAHQQRSAAALSLALLSLLGVLGLGLGLSQGVIQRGVYILGFALVVGVLAIWLAGTTIARARRSGTASPRGSLTAIIAGGIGVLASGVLLTGFALFWQQATTFSRCISGANTLTAQQSCQTQFRAAMQREIHSLGNPGH